MGPARPTLREFGSNLTASRGLLPAAWSEEIEEDRKSRALWETLWEDVRYGARLIRRNPLLSTVVVLTLTVGIGINASVFTVLGFHRFFPATPSITSPAVTSIVPVPWASRVL